MQLVLRVSGTGVTPFGIPQQTILLRAMASVLTTVSLADLQIRYVTSSVNLRRRLLADNDLHQVSAQLKFEEACQSFVSLNSRCKSKPLASVKKPQLNEVLAALLGSMKAMSIALQEHNLRQMGRALLQNDSAQAAAAAKGELYNVAAVTLQANCSDSNAAANTLSEMQSVLSNNLLAVSQTAKPYRGFP